MEQTRQNVTPMSNEGRNAYVIGQLNKAMLALLKEKPLQDISISELCNRAMVGRTSFYRNFETKEDVVKAYIQQLFSGWMKGDENDKPAADSLILAVFSHFELQRDFYSLLSERGLVHLLKDVILGLCNYSPAGDAVAAYASAFAGYSLYGWIDTWFQRGMAESAQELAELLRQ